MWLSPNLHLFLRLIFVTLILVLSFVDHCTMLLPDKLTIPLLCVGLVNASLLGMNSFLMSGLSALIAGGFFWLICIAYPRGMGMGDVKFVAALASFLGFPSIILVVFLASLTGTILGGVYILAHKSKFSQRIPFGPYLSFSALMVLLWGDKLLTLYWTFVFRGK